MTENQQSFKLFKRDFLPSHPDIIYHRVSRPEDVLTIQITGVIQDQIYTNDGRSNRELLSIAQQRIK